MDHEQCWFGALARFGDRTAIVDEAGEPISYAALAARADAFGETLGSAGLVAVAAARDAATIVAYLACLRRGIPVIMVEDAAKSDRLLAAFAPDLVVRSGSVAPGGGDGTAAHPALRLLLSTSGSTGSPKLVRLSAINLDSNARAIADYLAIGPDDVAITTLPLFYSYGVSVINSHLAAGAAIVVGEFAVTAADFLAATVRHGVTSIAGVPTTYELLTSSGVLDRLPPSVRAFTQAGGKLAAAQVTDLAARLARRGATLSVMYGQTEASPRMAHLPPAMLASHPDCIGQAIPGGSLTIQHDGVAVPQGEVGELVYRGPNVMMGYATTRADLARGPELAALNTGDLAREVVPGLFRIEGRLARFIKPLGLRIGLDELETLAGPGVRVAGSDTRGAVVVAATEAGLAAARAAHAILALPPSVISYHRVDAIPVLGSGKIDYPEILRLTVPKAASHAGSAAIAACFAEAARGAPVDDTVTYVQIGGDSLSFIEASIVVETALGTPRDDWATVPLGALMAAADAAAVAAASAGAAQTAGAPVPFWRGISADIVVRAAAIILVVLQHALGTFEGGADVMMVLGGLGFARFQLARIDDLGVARSLWANLARLLAIYYAIVLLYSLAKHKLFVSHLLLYSTFIGDWGGALNIYWFIESLVWCTVFASLAYAMLGNDRVRRNPLPFTVALFVVAIGIRYAGAMVFDAHAHRMRSPDQMLVYFAGGAVLANARAWGKVAVAAVLVALSSLAWGIVSTHAVIMAVCCTLLVARWRPLVPSAAHSTIRLVARHSFYIYIMCIVPMYLTDQILKTPFGRFWPLHVVVGIGTGLALGTLLDRDTLPRRLIHRAIAGIRRDQPTRLAAPSG